MNSKFDNSWHDIKKINIFGFGRFARSSIDFFIDEELVDMIIDNSKEIQGEVYRKITIMPLEECLKSDYAENKIVILATGKALISIKNSLEKCGKKEYKDYVCIDDFMGEWYMKIIKKLVLPKIVFSVTTKCTLNCKNCNMFIPYYKRKREFICEDLLKDADMVFSLVDFAACILIGGGETLLYPELSRFIGYLGEHYRRKIGKIQIVTNGTVMPSEDLLHIMKKNNVEVRISDYTHVVSYQNKIQKLIKILDEYDINHIEFKQTDWVSFGFPTENIDVGNSEEELKKHMLGCKAMCPLVHDGKYYYCASAWSAHEGGLFNLKEGDYLELAELLKNSDKGKRELMEFSMGKLKNGYMSFCKVCRGFNSNVSVIGGEQL